MDFQNVMEVDCGQSNPMSQLIQHVAEDKALQDNYVNPSASELQQYNSMIPHRMDDLVKDFDQIETHQALMSPRPSIPSQNHGLPDANWVIQYQEHSQIISTSQEHVEFFVEFDSRGTIENLDELEEESEPNCVTEPNSNADIIHRKVRKIPEFTNYQQFRNFLEDYTDKYCVHGPIKANYRKKFESVRKSILNSKKYSHIENNPMKKKSKVVIKGEKAVENRSYSQGILYLDEAIRRDPTNIMNWSYLIYALHKTKQEEQAISGLKQMLYMYPDDTYGCRFIVNIYNTFRCNYQVCYWIFNWLNNTKSYNHLIPTDFTMDDKNTPELDNGLLDTVKSIFIKAAQLNPTNPDSNLLLMMASLYGLSNDFDKELDCRRAAIKALNVIELDDEVINVGYLLLTLERPFEALEAFFSTLEIDRNRSSESIGIAYLYLKKYREAIRYFKNALDAIGSFEESKFQIQENTLEAEFELCLRLYLEYYNKFSYQD